MGQGAGMNSGSLASPGLEPGQRGASPARRLKRGGFGREPLCLAPVDGDGDVVRGRAAGVCEDCSLKSAYVRICSRMFAYLEKRGQGKGRWLQVTNAQNSTRLFNRRYKPMQGFTRLYKAIQAYTRVF
jgi:hypothetical protein